jgi:uncharacterized protein YdeI (YjbR/CyaY-like superfamily)
MPVISANKSKQNASKLIDEAFGKFTGFQKEYCNHLRKLIHKALPDVMEDWKWGPNFNVNGMVCGVWGFKDHVKLVFFKGSAMKDKYKLFNQGKENEGNRSINFSSTDKIDDKKIIEYLKEAAEINRKGIKLAKKEIKVIMPATLVKALNKDKASKAYFESLAPSHRRDYADYISQAKQEETQLRRLDKVMEMLADKRTLNDKYNKKG